MSTLGEHTDHGNTTEISLQREDTKVQIDSILQHFDVLPSKWDKVIFKYLFVFLIGTVLLGKLLLIPNLFFLAIHSQFQVGEFLLDSGFNVFPLLVILIIVWSFNIWRRRTPKTLRDLLEKKRIYVPDGDVNTSYFRFLEDYHDALASPKRYSLSSALMIFVVTLYAYSIVYILSINHPNAVDRLVPLLIVVENLLNMLEMVVGIYCIGIIIWVMYISGWYIRKLVRVFELSIQPFHPDRCGGLKSLGNFCFGLVSPILIGSGLIFGYSLAFSFYSLETGFDVVILAVDLGSILIFLLLLTFPAAIFAFVLPLRDIHTKMMSEGEADEDTYLARIKGLREEIQSLLVAKQVEAAKVMQEERVLVETLYTPYPTWPFSFRSKILSTALGTSGSILIGVITAALQDHFLPAIIKILFQMQ